VEQLEASWSTPSSTGSSGESDLDLDAATSVEFSGGTPAPEVAPGLRGKAGGGEIQDHGSVCWAPQRLRSCPDPLDRDRPADARGGGTDPEGLPGKGAGSRHEGGKGRGARSWNEDSRSSRDGSAGSRGFGAAAEGEGLRRGGRQSRKTGAYFPEVKWRGRLSEHLRQTLARVARDRVEAEALLGVTLPVLGGSTRRPAQAALRGSDPDPYLGLARSRKE
jgi:hypothetical protein